MNVMHHPVEENIRKLTAAYDYFISLERKLPAASSVDSLRTSCQEATYRLLTKSRSLMATNESLMSLQRDMLALPEVHGQLKKFEGDTVRLLWEYELERASLIMTVRHFLFNLDDRVHDEDVVKQVIEIFPDVLKRGDHGLPVRQLLYCSVHGHSFVPLLVTEGMKLGFYSKEERGGLDCGEPDSFQDAICDFVGSDLSDILDFGEYERLWNKNDVEFQVLKQEVEAIHDERANATLKKLFELNILEKEDIIKFELIPHSSRCPGKRFDFLVGICPEGLAEPMSCGDELPLQFEAKQQNIDGFGALLKMGLRYYPRQLGFLFHWDPTTGKRSIDLAMSSETMELSYNDLFQYIYEVIPPSSNHPILHDVIRLAPKYFSLFWKHYPDAIYLRDEIGRLPLHIALQKAPKWSHPMLSLIVVNNPIDRHEKDPVTGLYPFMSAASGSRNDLKLIYFLLRRDPSVWEGFRMSP